MRLWLWTGFALLIAGALGWAGYQELVVDARAQRSQLGAAYALGTNILFVPTDYEAVIQAMKKKHGDKADTRYYSKEMHVRTTLDGKVVEESLFRARVDLLGIFVVGPKRTDDDGIFPFRFEQWEAAKGDNGKQLTEDIKQRFAKDFTPKYLAFSELQWGMASCFVATASELGLFTPLASILDVKPSTSCVSYWRGPHRGSMLVGLHVVDGGDWVRTFSKRICRWLTAAALEKLQATDKQPAPEYATCILLDRRYLHDSNLSLVLNVYEVRRDGTLAVIR